MTGNKVTQPNPPHGHNDAQTFLWSVTTNCGDPLGTMRQLTADEICSYIHHSSTTVWTVEEVKDAILSLSEAWDRAIAARDSEDNRTATLQRLTRLWAALLFVWSSVSL